MVRTVAPSQALELISRGEVDVIDVRDPGEWSGGHVAGARLIPLDELRANPASALTRDGVLFVCAAGMRSQTAARIAAEFGLTTIYNLSGGTRGWTKAGLPLVSELSIAV
jgi:rhodanese-related sulfurtransferase